MDKIPLKDLLQRAQKFINCNLIISTKGENNQVKTEQFKFINITYQGFGEPGYEMIFNPYASLISDSGTRISEPLLNIVVCFEKNSPIL